MMIDEKEAIERLKAAVKSAGGVRAFAAENDISPTMISFVQNEKHRMTEEVAKRIGLKPVPCWDDGR